MTLFPPLIMHQDAGLQDCASCQALQPHEWRFFSDDEAWACFCLECDSENPDADEMGLL